MEQDRFELLVEALKNPAVWPHDVATVETIETHISVIFLVGDYAYKLKKPIDLGFLDFSTLEKRRFYCEEEVRLNRRLAPDVYLTSVPICGDYELPHIGEEGEAVEWLVKMRRFDEHAVLADQPERLDEELVSQLARDIADFHRRAEPLDLAQPFGTPEMVLQPMLENFAQLRQLTTEAAILEKLDPLEGWTRNQCEQLREQLLERRHNGSVCECHGDLHLGNIVVEDGRPLIFDGIEFSPGLRWLDTLNDLAFLLMDLHHKERPDLAGLLLNRYLDANGDYAGLPLLPFYLTYRAMVRAKVTAIRLAQPHLKPEEIDYIHRECLAYLELAESFTHPGHGAVAITHGLSGSGKTTACEALLTMLPLVRIRSDVERKRLAGIDFLHRSDNPDELYGAEMTERTYDHLAQMAGAIVASGYIALIDAAFLKCRQRQQFSRLAAGLNVPFLILEFDLPEAELRRRIEARTARNDDASDADISVLELQLQEQEVLGEQERQSVISANIPVAKLAELIKAAVHINVDLQ